MESLVVRHSLVGEACAGSQYVVRAWAPIVEAGAEKIEAVVNSSEPMRIARVSAKEALGALVVRVELVRARDAMVDEVLQRLGREGLCDRRDKSEKGTVAREAFRRGVSERRRPPPDERGQSRGAFDKACQRGAARRQGGCARAARLVDDRDLAVVDLRVQ